LNQWLLPRVRAVRPGGDGFLTREQLDSGIWRSTTHGPDDPAEHLMGCLNTCRAQRPAAFFYSLHGVDGEAWGAIALDSLRKALEIIMSEPTLEYSTLPFN
jgi:hypothetical protein